MDAIVITSENLITNRKSRESLIGYGNLADSCKEALAIIREGLKKVDELKDSSTKNGSVESSLYKYISVGPYEDEIPQIGQKMVGDENENEENISPVNGETLQLNVKLFLREHDKDVAMEAINYVGTRLSTSNIDNVYVTVPANSVAHIGLTSHSSDTEPSTAAESDAGSPSSEAPKVQTELDPERAKYAEDMTELWNNLSQMKSVDSLGLCDLETDVFKKIYNEADIKPKNVQVNLKSCCVVPPELRDFAKSNDIKLLTHSDSPEFLGDEFCSQINAGKGQKSSEGKENRTTNDHMTNVDEEWTPLWIIRFQIFKKMRGVLHDKRYMIALKKNRS